MNPLFAIAAVVIVSILFATGAKQPIKPKTTVVISPTITRTPTPTDSENPTDTQSVEGIATQENTPTPSPTIIFHQGNSNSKTSVTVNGKTIEPDSNGNVDYTDGNNSVKIQNNSTSNSSSQTSTSTTINTNISTNSNTQ